MLNFKKKNRLQKLIDEFGQLKNDSFHFDQIESYFRKKDNSTSFQTLSDKTCNDFDFEELFMFLDRTNSKVGQQYLYNKLRNIPFNSNENNAQESIIKEFADNSDFRAAVQQQLSKLNNNEAFYISSLFQDEHISKPNWYFVVPLLAFTSFLSCIMVFFYPAMFLVLIVVFIINMLIHYWNKKNLFMYIGSIPQLVKLNAVATQLFKNPILNKLNPELKNSIKIIEGLNKQMPFFIPETKLQPDFQLVMLLLIESIKTLFLIEPLILFKVLNQLETKRKEIEDLFIFVGKVDCLISIASLRAGLTDYCFPTIIDAQKKLVVNQVYHPLIFDCVKNSLGLDNKSILLTGSNMSGKTSFIRSIGISALTGLTLNTCFASDFSMPRIRIYSAIRISDDLMNDKSYYFEEVLTIKEMIDNSDNECSNLFLLDEIFKGTNTIERISAGKAVLSSLTKANNIVFVSTHDVELAELLKSEFELYHFSESVNDKSVEFDYKLKIGKLKNRNAIRILQINDYPESIINEAFALSKTLDELTVNYV